MRVIRSHQKPDSSAKIMTGDSCLQIERTIARGSLQRLSMRIYYQIENEKRKTDKDAKFHRYFRRNHYR